MSMPLHPAEVRRLGAYELLGRLGRGGMGAVYLGRAPGGRTVAIKVIRAELADDELRGRFRSEVNRLRQVPSFSTAAVLDADVDHDPPYLVVEYVDGPSLADVVRERGPLPAEQLRGVAIGITTALTAIHGAGVIHRDLKPENVLLPVGGVKVIDFGIARSLEATSLHTRTDQMVGTVAYMAPERFDSDSSRTVTPAADIFAWGVMMTYAATGRTPFSADSPPATAMKILTQPPDLSGLDQSMRGVVEWALHKDPARRPTARQLLDALLSDADTVPHAYPPPAPAPGPRPAPRPAPGPRSAPRPAFASPVTAKERIPAPRRGRRFPLAAIAGAAFLAVAAVITVIAVAITTYAADDVARDSGGYEAYDEPYDELSPSAAPSPERTVALKPATPQALLELLHRMYPDRELTRAAADDERMFVQVLMDGGKGPGRMGVYLYRDKNPDNEKRTGAAPTVEVARMKGNCIQDVVVTATWDDGTHVQLDISTCLPWNGRSNPEAPPPLTVAEARKVAADPRWGMTMDAELIDEGAKRFPKLIKL